MWLKDSSKKEPRRSSRKAAERVRSPEEGAKEVKGWGQKVETKADDRTLLESRKECERRKFERRKFFGRYPDSNPGPLNERPIP